MKINSVPFDRSKQIERLSRAVWHYESNDDDNKTWERESIKYRKLYLDISRSMMDYMDSLKDGE